MPKEVPRDRETAYDCRGPDYTLPSSLLSLYLEGGVPVHWRGVEAVEQSHRPEPQKGLSTSQGASVCMWLEDGDKIPEAPSPGPPRPLLP